MAASAADVMVRTSGWQFEDGKGGDGGQYYKPAIENPEADLRWYETFFIGKEHKNYIGKDEKVGTVIVSIVKEVISKKDVQFRGIVWSKSGKRQVLIDGKSKVTTTDVLRAADPDLVRVSKKLVAVLHENFITELCDLEKIQSTKRYKFGVILVKEGQTKEEIIFANDTTPAFDQFLSLLGTKIELVGWDGYRAGLDVKGGNTGSHSVFTVCRGYEIMFHVGPLLPHDDTGQEVQRKRHIGNDIVVVVFTEGKTPYNPRTIDTQFNHVYACVQPDEVAGRYKVGFAYKDSVPSFGPALPQMIMNGDRDFTDFLITKLINGERSTLRSPEFMSKYKRTQETLLSNLYDKFKAIKPNAPSPPAVVSKPPEDMLGSPDAKSRRGAIASVGSTEDKIFESKVVLTFQTDIECLDSWAGNFVYSNKDGCFVSMINENNPVKFSKTAMSHMQVLESLGILITRSVKSQEIHVFFLSTLRGTQINEKRIKGTKRTHLYAVGQPRTKVYLVCAIGREMILFGWEGQAFERVTDYQLPAAPKVVQFVDMSLCVAFHTEFDEVDLQTGEVHELFVTDMDIEPLDVLQLDAKELLLCYNNTGVIINRLTKVKKYDLRWTATPLAFAYSLPYVLAATPKYVEVRTLLNGSLIQTINLPAPIRLLSSKNAVYVSTKSAAGVQVHEIKPNVSTTLTALTVLSNEMNVQQGAGPREKRKTRGGTVTVTAPEMPARPASDAAPTTGASSSAAPPASTATGSASSQPIPTTVVENGDGKRRHKAKEKHKKKSGSGSSSGSGSGSDSSSSSSSSKSSKSDAPPSDDAANGNRTLAAGTTPPPPRPASLQVPGDKEPGSDGELADTQDLSMTYRSANTTPLKPDSRPETDPRDYTTAMTDHGPSLESGIRDPHTLDVFRQALRSVPGHVQTLVTQGSTLTAAGRDAQKSARLDFLNAVCALCPPLITCISAATATPEQGDDVRATALEYPRLREAHATIVSGVATARQERPSAETVVNGTRSTLMGVKQLKHAIDNYAEAMESEDRALVLEDTSDELAAAAAHLLAATKTYVNDINSGPAMAEVHGCASQMGDIAMDALRLGLREAVVHDMSQLEELCKSVGATPDQEAGHKQFLLVVGALAARIRSLCIEVDMAITTV